MITYAVLVCCLLGASASSIAKEEKTEVNVGYLLWYHPEPVNALPEKLSLSIEASSTFFNVMEKAAATNANNYQFEYEEFPFGKYIKSIGGVAEEVEKNIVWMLYVLDFEPNTSSPPADEFQAKFGVDGLIVEEGKNYLFWRKVEIWE